MPETFIQWLGLYGAAVSLLSVVITILDKHFAKVHAWRVSESTLLLLAALGGALPMYLCMRLIRHKTKKRKFMLGLPVITLLQLAGLCGLTLLWLR